MARRPGPPGQLDTRQTARRLLRAWWPRLPFRAGARRCCHSICSANPEIEAKLAMTDAPSRVQALLDDV